VLDCASIALSADVFVHANYLVNVDLLRKDQRVSFEVVNDDRRGKPGADKVRVLLP
jgi:cold shock CspA family protein